MQTFIWTRFRLGPDQVGGPAKGYSVTKRTLRGGLRDGVDVVEVDNGRFRFVVVPTRGMGLYRASCGDVQLGWHSPVKGPVHPDLRSSLGSHAASAGSTASTKSWSAAAWRATARPSSAQRRAPLLRCTARSANMPAHKVEVTHRRRLGRDRRHGRGRRGPAVRQQAPPGHDDRHQGRPALDTVTDEITNISAEPGELELLYHINFGLPLVTPGAKVALPVKKTRPRDAAAAADLPNWNSTARRRRAWTRRVSSST